MVEGLLFSNKAALFQPIPSLWPRFFHVSNFISPKLQEYSQYSQEKILVRLSGLVIE